MNSKFLKLGIKDAIKGLFLAVIMSIVTGLYQVIQAGGKFDFETLKTIGITAVGVALSYAIKNWLTNSNDEILKKE